MKTTEKFILLLICTILTLSFSGCFPQEPAASEPTLDAATPAPTEESAPALQLLDENIQPDNIRNWYEIFVYSYADSDRDGIGDFNGLTDKLDYVRDMGFTGIWLMPIMPSPSYHKYDVTDYYSVDAQYGTTEDFQAFLSRAHELEIKIIIDLPINHTSSEHPWFLSALSESNSPYRDYYNFTTEALPGHTPTLGGEYYESQFVSTMPDLNLDNPEVRTEISNIMRYWLEMGVDGFRLDACTSYYTGAPSASIEFISWLNNEAKSISPDCYIVGECWADMATIANYYEGGIDSFFCFPVASTDGYINKALRDTVENRGERYSNMTALLEETFGTDAILAPFLGNHDLGRITGTITNKDMSKLKAASGMLAMMRGAMFYYYGDEIGMVGSGDDPNKRIGMLWTTEDETTKAPPGTSKIRYLLPGVEEQEADPASLLNYVRTAMNIRNAIPAIARGTSEIIESGDAMVSIIRRTWEDESVIIVLNLCGEGKNIELSECKQLLATLDASMEGINFENGILTVSPWGIAILQ